ncbi:dynamin family protein [Colletotrichum plurivorum]|uniref:Dynamin family protein n=1 Tax=Colletotrichum plurivorum TaxID=2175906 RepID=A0A8H6K4T0_9PEZI|nr:dynamin family protein [Colletotrichum plurivorum]
MARMPRLWHAYTPPLTGCAVTPGTLSSTVVLESVADACRPWENILISSARKIMVAVELTASAIVASVADHRIEPFVSRGIRLVLDSLVKDLDSKTREVLAPYNSKQPLACTQHITEAVRQAQRNRTKKRMQERLKESTGLSGFSCRIVKLNPSSLLDEMTSHVEEELRQQPVALAIDYTKAYYQAALQRTIDSFNLLAVEACVLQKLPGIFADQCKMSMNEALLRIMIAKSQAQSWVHSPEYRSLMEQYRFLKKCFDELKDYLPAEQPGDASSDTDECIYTPQFSLSDISERLWTKSDSDDVQTLAEDLFNLTVQHYAD